MEKLEYEILDSLWLSFPEKELRWITLFNTLLQKQKKPIAEDSFKIIVIRKIRSLNENGYIEKREENSRKIFYSIPKSKWNTVQNELLRREVHQSIDKLWDSLTDEQRKGMVAQLQRTYNFAIFSSKVILNILDGKDDLTEEEFKVKGKKILEG